MSEQKATPGSYVRLWAAMQEVGAALNDFGGDLPNVLRALDAAMEEARDFVEASAEEEAEHG